LHRASEIDVDELGPEDLRYQRRSLPHRNRVCSEDLNANWPLVGPEAELTDGRFVFAPNAFRGKKFSDDHIRPKPPAETPKRRLRHSGHRREVERNGLTS